MSTNTPYPYRWYELAAKYFSEPGKWEAWYKPSTPGYWTVSGLPTFRIEYEWELRPVIVPVKMVIGKTKPFPKPHSEVLEAGETYWFVALSSGFYVYQDWWACLSIDYTRLKNRQVHLTESAAKQHADALRDMTFEEVSP